MTVAPSSVTEGMISTNTSYKLPLTACLPDPKQAAGAIEN